MLWVLASFVEFCFFGQELGLYSRIVINVYLVHSLPVAAEPHVLPKSNVTLLDLFIVVIPQIRYSEPMEVRLWASNDSEEVSDRLWPHFFAN